MSFKINTISSKKADEECTVAVHSSGLKVYLSTKESFKSNYAVLEPITAQLILNFRLMAAK